MTKIMHNYDKKNETRYFKNTKIQQLRPGCPMRKTEKHWK
jgi:hypothetical protein